jgi:hypothetical protein
VRQISRKPPRDGSHAGALNPLKMLGTKKILKLAPGLLLLPGMSLLRTVSLIAAAALIAVGGSAVAAFL